MALEKVVLVDMMEILEDGHIQVRTVTRVLEDGVIISESNHREVVSPGDDYSKQPDNVKAICAVVHTADSIQKYKDKQKSILPAFPEMDPSKPPK
jgi:pantothenate synthetase